MDLSAIDKQQAEKTLQLIHSGLRNKEMYRTLRVIYEPFAIATNQALGLSGNAGFRLADDHAAVFCEFSDAQTLADICGNDGTTSVDATKFAIDAGARQDLISKVRSVDGTPNQDIESGNNYCLQSVNVDRGRLSISIQRATYGQIMRTSDCLIEEIGLFYGLAEGLKFKSEHVLWLLPWRRRVMAVDEKWRLFAQPRSRAAGLGMAALTAYQSQNRKFEALLGFRSNAVATYTNKWHVVPAGMCNTRDIAFFKDYFNTAITSEFLEEVFNRTELEGIRHIDWIGAVDENIRTMIPALVRGKDWQVLANGICFDLLNLRPEICVAIIFASPPFAHGNNPVGGLSRVELNYEYAGSPMTPQLDDHRESPDLFSIINGRKVPCPEAWVQSGAVAYLLAESRIRRMPNS